MMISRTSVCSIMIATKINLQGDEYEESFGTKSCLGIYREASCDELPQV